MAIHRNEGIVSTGDGAVNTQLTAQTAVLLAANGVPSPGAVAGPSGLVELGAAPVGAGWFVGREEELAALDASDAVARVVVGMGGIGKTTLVKRWVLARRADFSVVWWLTAENAAQVRGGLAGLARRLCPVLGALPEEVGAQWARGWLAGHEGWLVVMDDVEDPAEAGSLIDALPNGRFLLTSRLTVGWEGIAEVARLEVLDEADAVGLLETVAGAELREGAEDLCRALGWLPLAVQLAGSYLRQNHVTAAAYLEWLREPDSAVLAWTPSQGDPERTVARIWARSLERIEAEGGEQALGLLRILGWTAPDGVPMALLVAAGGFDRRTTEEAVGRIAAYGLLKRSGEIVAVHRLVQKVARGLAGSRDAAVRLISAIEFPAIGDDGDVDDFLMRFKQFQHAARALEGDRKFARALIHAFEAHLPGDDYGQAALITRLRRLAGLP